MDPLSITASIPALIELAGNLISFLYRLKNASSEQTTLRNEIATVSGLLTALDMRREDMKADDEGFAMMRALTVKGGAVDQCKISLERLRGKTDNDNISGIEKLGRDLTWHFRRNEVNEALASVERLKSSLSLALTNDVGVLVQKMKVNSDVLIRDVSELKDGFESQKIQKECQEVGDWLSPFDFRAIQQDILHRCHAGTGKWMLESDEFQQWSSSHNETLWCPGIPGAGKTYLASITIDYLQRQTSSEGLDIVLCLFCNFDKQANQTAYNFMGALLKQLTQASQTLPVGIRSIYNTRERGRRPEFRDLVDIFRTELKRFSKAFVVIDALDEVLESADIRTILLKELRSCPVNLLVTSRHDPIIEKEFFEAQRCDIRATDEDIRSYISERIGQENRLSRLIRSFPSLRDDIPARIVGSAKGMFLLARFHMDQISNMTKPKQIEMALEQLPQELNDNYGRTIDRLKSQGSDCWGLARKVLLWVSTTLVPISLGALQEAVAVEPGMNSMGIRDLDDIESMISACAGLVVLEEIRETPAPRLVHYTLQEYLTENQTVLSPNPHAEVARACLAFLSFDDFSKMAPDCWLRWQHDCMLQSEHTITILSTQEFTSPYQFTCYAGCCWGTHAQRAGEVEVMDETLDFLSRPANVAYDWLMLMAAERWIEGWKRVLYEELSVRDPEFLAMLLAVRFGLVIVLAKLLETHTKPAANELDQMISRLACDAAKRGNREIVRLLLTQNDVDWNMCCIDGENLLMLLAERNDEDNLRTLLQTKNCSVNTFTNEGSVLQRAVGSGYTSITRILLEAGAEVDASGNIGHSVIYRAMKGMVSGESWGEMMDVLLEYKADINALSCNDTTPLHYVAGDYILDTYAVEYLVSKGANLNLPNRLRKTPLDMAKAAVFEARGVDSKGNPRYPKDEVERAAQIISILQKAGGKTAKEMNQLSIGEQGPCFPEWLDRLEKLKEWNSLYEPGAQRVTLHGNEE